MAVPLQRIAEARGVSNQRRVVQEDRRAPETSVADATAEFGKVAGEVVRRRREAQVQSDLAKAEIRVRDGLDKLTRKIEQDPSIDPDDMEATYNRLSGEIIARAAKGFSDNHREAWQEISEQLRLGGRTAMRTASTRRAAELARASVVSASAEYERLAEDPATSAATLAASEKSLRALARNMRAQGVLGADDYAQMVEGITDQSRAAVSLRHVSNVDKLAEMGRYGEAEAYLKANYGEISPSEREALEDDIEARGREGTAIGMVDDMMDRGLSESEIAAEIRKIDDPALRQMVEQRRDYEVRQREARRGEAREEIFETYGDAIWGGEITSVTQIPRAEREVLTQQELSALDTIINRRTQGGPDVKTDFASSDMVISMLETGDADTALSLLRGNLDKFSRSDQQSLRRMIASARGDASDAGGGVDLLRTRNEMINQGLRDSGLAESDGNPDPGMRGAVMLELDRRSEAWQRANSTTDAPPEEWQRDTIDELTREIKLGRPQWWWTSWKDQPRGGVRFRSDDIPVDYQAAVVAAFPNIDRLRERDAISAYNVAVAALAERGISNPTPTQVTMTIELLREQAAGAE